MTETTICTSCNGEGEMDLIGEDERVPCYACGQSGRVSLDEKPDYVEAFEDSYNVVVLGWNTKTPDIGNTKWIDITTMSGSMKLSTYDCPGGYRISCFMTRPDDPRAETVVRVWFSDE